MRTLPIALLLLTLPATGVAQTPLCLGDPAFRVGYQFADARMSPDGRLFAIHNQNEVHLLDTATGRIVRSWTDQPLVVSVTFDDAGRLLIADGQGWLRTFDPDTGRVVREILLSGPDERLSFCQLLAGGRVAFVFRKDPIRASNCSVWLDTTNGLPLVEIPTADDNLPRGISDDGRLFANVTYFNPNCQPQGELDTNKWPRPSPQWVQLRDLAVGRERWVKLPPGRVRELAFVPGGRLLFLGDGAGYRLLDLRTGQHRPLELEGWQYQPHDPGFCPGFSPDGARMAARCEEPGRHPFIREWETTTGRLLREWRLPDPDFFRTQYTTSGRLLCWSWAGCQLRVADLDARRWPHTEGHFCSIRDLRFSADGTQLESLDDDGRICLWDTRTSRLLREERIPTTCTAGGAIQIMGFGQDSSTVLMERWGGAPGALRFDRARDRVASAAPPEGFTSPSLVPDRCWQLGSHQDRPALHELSTGRIVALPKLETLWPEANASPIQVLHEPRADVLVVTAPLAGDPVLVRIVAIQPSTQQILSRYCVESGNWHVAIVLAPDGSGLAYSSKDGVSIFDPRTGRQRRHWPSPLDQCAIPLAFSTDGRCLLIFTARNRDAAGELVLLEIATGSVRQRWTTPGVRAPYNPFGQERPRFSPDNRLIAYPVPDGTILLLPTDLPAQPLDPATLWHNLGSRDAAIANVAVQALAARPSARKEIAARRLLPAGDNADTVDPVGLLPDLDTDDPVLREAAQQRLRSVPTAQVEALQASLLNPAPEVRRALRGRLEVADEVPELTTDQLRRLRVAEVLDRLSKQ
jgi:WD40 repeat protein